MCHNQKVNFEASRCCVYWVCFNLWSFMGRSPTALNWRPNYWTLIKQKRHGRMLFCQGYLGNVLGLAGGWLTSRQIISTWPTVFKLVSINCVTVMAGTLSQGVVMAVFMGGVWIQGKPLSVITSPELRAVLDVKPIRMLSMVSGNTFWEFVHQWCHSGTHMQLKVYLDTWSVG